MSTKISEFEHKNLNQRLQACELFIKETVPDCAYILVAAPMRGEETFPEAGRLRVLTQLNLDTAMTLCAVMINTWKDGNVEKE